MKTPIEIDLHCFELRFLDARLRRHRQLARLRQSLERHGQQTPVTAVRADERLVLIDGYLRFEALRGLGHDTIVCDISPEPVTGALLSFLSKQQSRTLEPIEQAWLIAGLLAEGMEQAEVARRLGRDKSWVSRHLSLVTEMPEAVQQAVRAGDVSSWTATRVLKPLARANAAHAEDLLDKLKEHPIPTRQLTRWYHYYQQANQGQRAKMVAEPALFLQSLANRESSQEADTLQEGPEGEWLSTAEKTIRLLRHLQRRLATVADANTQTPPQMTRLSDAASRLENQFQRFQQQAKEHFHAQRKHPANHSGASCPEHTAEGDQPLAEGLAQQCAPRSAGTAHPKRPASPEVGRHHLDLARTLLADAGQRGTHAGAAQ